ncbi:hypothetical protein HP398_05070 [Brevibacillus sp. HB1.4B]|uniref:hypothetical protein n=1 Tax=Brevibacillus sp. HB1.4B TaxID=2738845 RepID=UPI00156A7860|nr:hypothetical protein [Brevibacillus sp. HB1.4B]NRS15804.1 hypothetical protein [Brevibacillus sp. HB1.4B]
MGRHLKQTDLAQLRTSEQAKVNTELQSAYEAIAALHETVEVLQKEVQTLKGGVK